jgi:hypothetical protein
LVEAAVEDGIGKQQKMFSSFCSQGVLLMETLTHTLLPTSHLDSEKKSAGVVVDGEDLLCPSCTMLTKEGPGLE